MIKYIFYQEKTTKLDAALIMYFINESKTIFYFKPFVSKGACMLLPL